MAGMVSAVLPRRMLISPARPPSIVWPAQGRAGSKQDQHGHQQRFGAGCGIQRAKIGSGGRHSAQNDHNQGCSAHSDCCARW